VKIKVGIIDSVLVCDIRAVMLLVIVGIIRNPV
jgi:hypothetical protein